MTAVRIIRFSQAAGLLAVVTVASPAPAQPGQNIAGTYRGQVTTCLSSARPTDCRKGFAEIIRLADDVDARRAEWEKELTSGGAGAASTQKSYTQALEQLNRVIIEFNRIMAPSRGQSF